MNYLILFYADWCSHCTNFKPLWQELENEIVLTTFNIKFLKYESESEFVKNLIMNNQSIIQGYPTIYYIDDSGSVKIFDKERTLDNLKKFINYKKIE